MIEKNCKDMIQGFLSNHFIQRSKKIQRVSQGILLLANLYEQFFQFPVQGEISQDVAL